MTPWFGHGFLGKPKRKFLNGQPDPEYWGPGFHENLREPPTRKGVVVHEISPVQDRYSTILASASPRSLEIVKNPGDEGIHILASAAPDDESYPAETGHDCTPVDAAAPKWIHDERARAFDVELTTQLNFAPVTPPAHALNMLARTIAPRVSDGMWILAVFENRTDILARLALRAHDAISEAQEMEGDMGLTARTLEPHYAARAGSPLAALSVRGAFVSDSPAAILDSLDATFGAISIECDTLTTCSYDTKRFIPWLESRQLASEGAYDLLDQNCAMWKDPRLGFGRDMTPILVLTPSELSALLRIPDDPALDIRYMRRRRGGAKEDVLGHDLASNDYSRLTVSSASISPEHMLAHTYLLGATGTGKTSLMRSFAHHISTPKQGYLPPALIIIDVKDDDGPAYFTQLDPEVIASGRVRYIDINHTDFAINPLELPPHTESTRDLVVSRKVGQVASFLKEVYSQRTLMVQVERLIRLLLTHLYSRSSSPTMADLYNIITTNLNDPTAAARRMATASPELSQALSSLAKMPRDSWIPLINRIEPFAVDAYMKKRFSVRHGTVDFAKMLEPGQITIIRASEAETPQHAHPIIPTIISLGIWNALLARAESRAERTPVMLFLDEFHMMRDVTLLKSMLSRGRSLGLGLVLAHQNLSQVDRSLLDTIMGNTSTHIHGRVLGVDARTIATVMDPAHAAELTDQISGLPDHSFLISRVPPAGAERAPPVRFEAHAPPPCVMDPAQLEAFQEKMSELHQPDRTADSTPLDAWRSELLVELPTRLEWHIIIAMRHAGSSTVPLAKGAVLAGLIRERHAVSSALSSMVRRGLVQRVSSVRCGSEERPTHALTEACKKMYLPESFGSIGTAKGIEEAARAAFEHHVSLGHFVTVASQGRTIDSKNTVDMIAYDYETDSARSVEVESITEVKSNPEHVIFNMTKWEDMGFVGCDTWSANPAVVSLRERVPEPTRMAVTCHVLQDGEWTSRTAVQEKIGGT